VGGILGEQVGGRLILGLGVNLRSAPDIPGRAFPPACLRDLGLTPPPIQSLADHIAKSWRNLDRDFQPPFRWPEAGTPIRWEEGQGTCLGWEADGRLKVATSAGLQRLSAGEVRGLGLDG
jgi:hypothetical protein